MNAMRLVFFVQLPLQKNRIFRNYDNHHNSVINLCNLSLETLTSVMKPCIILSVCNQEVEQISNVAEILKTIEESWELRTLWDKYRKQFAYAEDVTYEQIMDAVKDLVG